MPNEPTTPVSNPNPVQQVAIAAPVGLVYTNGVNLMLSQSDIQLTLTVNGRPSMVIAMGIATAKTLQLNLEKVISNYEQKTGVSVFDLNELADLLKK